LLARCDAGRHADVYDLSHPHQSTQGAAQLSDEGAATLAAMLTSIRGSGAPGTTPAECRDVTPSFLADFNAVRPSAHCGSHAWTIIHMLDGRTFDCCLMTVVHKTMAIL
jgi:hypothetical protein